VMYAAAGSRAKNFTKPATSSGSPYLPENSQMASDFVYCIRTTIVLLFL
jgi:hypothetical protein